MSYDAIDALVTLVVGAVGPVLAYVGIKATNKAQKEAAEPANWQTLTTEMKAFFREQLEERDRLINELRKEQGDTRAYIAHLDTIPEFTDPPFPSFHKWRAGRS